jgi:hypothetical protein
MVLVAGVLMVALLVAIVGMVSADTVTWESAVAHIPAEAARSL